MKKKGLKTLIATMAITVIVGTLVGCSSSKSGDSSSDSSSKPAAVEKLSGSITASGSTALQPLADEAAKTFQEKNTDVTVTVQGGGSGAGLKDVAAGNVQIGNSDVFAEEKLPADQASTLKDNKVCVVGFAAVINQKVTGVDSLTKEQLVGIFTGKIKNWKEVNGNDLPIKILNRPATSGTRATFKKYALGGQEEAQGTALTEDSSGAVSKTVKSIDGAISYLASSFLNTDANKKDLKILKFNGVEMTPANIMSGKYEIWSYEHMYTKGEADKVTKAFLDYMTGADFKKTISDLGYIPISDMKATR